MKAFLLSMWLVPALALLSSWNVHDYQSASSTHSSLAADSFFSLDIVASEKEDYLNFHNRVRAEVGVEPVVWSDEVAAVAQEWAETVARDCNLRHREESNYGENCALNYEGTLTSAAQQWYAEKKKFKNEVLNEHNWNRAGHYSQMIWKNTNAIGAGKARCANGSWIIIGNYNPPGNMLGQKAY